jgi:nicotinamide riboside kinase
MITKKEPKFKQGQIVICIINSRATLTIGKEYKIKGVMIDENDMDLVIDNDDNVEYWYDSERFMAKDEFRDITLNQILK